jgi:competence protein ComEC
MAAFGTGPLLAASAGIILLGLLRTPLRWSGAGLAAVAVVWALRAQQPEILIAGDGQQVAVRGPDGRLHVIQTAKDSFRLQQWLAADGDARAADHATLRDGVSCDAEGCVAPLPDGALVALALHPEALADDCARAAIIVTARSPPPSCAALLIDRNRLRGQGALALHQSDGRFVIDAVWPDGVERPWAPKRIAEAPARDSRANPRPVDATPAEVDLRPDD